MSNTSATVIFDALKKGGAMRNPGVSRGVSLILLTAPFCCGQPQPAALREQIVAQERAELDSLKTGDLKTFANFLGDDAVFVDAQGAAGKAEVVKHTADFRLHEYAIADVRFVRLSADSGPIVYTMTESGASHGKEFAARVHVSAVWLKRDGRWMCVFSQETAAK